ncbi:MAG: ABC transporter permease [Lachnospiraceae bacterium]|nr:ABC transporter permease [Lachnospiraceae bacterium]
MWKDYRRDFIKNNRILSMSIAVAAFIATLFLSLLCSLFYNMWNYDMERIEVEEGAWHIRIVGMFEASVAEALERASEVESVRVNEVLSDGSQTTLELVMEDAGAVYEEAPKLVETLGIDGVTVEYHTVLLSNYLIFDPEDTTPPLLLLFYIFVLVVVSISLILIIHNTFAVSMNAQMAQLGTLSGIGATPKQIRVLLLGQALSISLVPMAAGAVLGIGLSAVFVFLINRMASNVAGRHEASFVFHPGILALTIVVAFITILLSAWRPAHKMSKLTPLQAMKGTIEGKEGKRYTSLILGRIFGIRGELAGSILKKQKKSLRTATLSLTFSFLGFAMILCFFALSRISTQETYFERYKDVWDVMITVKDTDMESLTISSMPEGVSDAVVYQKAETSVLLETNGLSEELLTVCELKTVSGLESPVGKDSIQGTASVIVMDDESFAQYCKDSVPEAKGSGVVIWNRVWNSVDSNFRQKEYIPFLNEEKKTVVLQGDKIGEITFDVAGFADKLPVLREEYKNGSLVLFVPFSLLAEQKAEALCEQDTYIRVLVENRTSPEELNCIEEEMVSELGDAFAIESENRIEEEDSNRKMMSGIQYVVGALCVLLAVIGIANVFSYTLCFANERKKEFARYFSTGMTTKDMVGMLAVEAFVIAVRPLLITVPLTVLFVVFAAKASYISIGRIVGELPFVAVGIFALFILASVALAYYIGVKRLFRNNLVEVLRDDRLN